MQLPSCIHETFVFQAFHCCPTLEDGLQLFCQQKYKKKNCQATQTIFLKIIPLFMLPHAKSFATVVPVVIIQSCTMLADDRRQEEGLAMLFPKC